MGGDNNPWAPQLATVHKAHSRVCPSLWLVGCGGHVEVGLSRMEPDISEWIFSARAADDVPEDQVDRADQGQAYPLVGLPAKRRHDQPDETHVVCALHRKQASPLCARQTAGVCEDDGVLLSGKVADDASAEGADEEVQAERAERWATGKHRAALQEGWAALPGDAPRWVGAAADLTCLEHSEPAEGVSIPHQLRILILLVLLLLVAMETPPVSILEDSPESSSELQAVHQQQQPGRDLPLTRGFGPGGCELVTAGVRVALRGEADADSQFVSQAARGQEAGLTGRGEALFVGDETWKREAGTYHGSGLRVDDNPAAADGLLVWGSSGHFDHTAAPLHLLQLHAAPTQAELSRKHR